MSVTATSMMRPEDFAWRGHWIAVHAPSIDGDDNLGVDLPPGEFSRTLFRSDIHLEEVPSQAPTRITADSRYVLWVNGNEVGRGPARSQPLRQRFDTYDLAPFLRRGKNVVAVLVTYYGQGNAFWAPAPAGPREAMLVFEAAIGSVELVSDSSWRVAVSEAWSVPSVKGEGIHGVPVEILDARALPRNWQGADYDDSTWAKAATVPASHMGGLSATRPPSYPYGRLLPRGASAPRGQKVSPTAVLDCSVHPEPIWMDDNPARRVAKVLSAIMGDYAAAELPVEAVLTRGRVQHIAFDFGRIVAGFVEMRINAPAGTVFEMHYRERPFDGMLYDAGSDPLTGARYIAAGGEGTFVAQEINGLRYLHVVVHGKAPGIAIITGLQVREYLYPRTGGAYFMSNDPQLNLLYRAGIRTVELSSFDAYVDCPTREQRSWVGDGVVHQLVDLATNEDWGLARNYVELGDSPRSDGILPMTVASEMESIGGLTIPDWSLSWAHGVYVLFQHEGDLERVRSHLPTMERILRWYWAYADDRGTIANVPEWNLVDWSSIFLTGRSSILTALWARSLNEFALLSEAAGNFGSAQWARFLYETAAAGFEDFWDSRRGLYVDHILEGELKLAASQVAGAAAIVSGLAPRERWEQIISKITDPNRLVVRSWAGDENIGSYSPEKLEELAAGIQRVDWDVENEIVQAQPYFSYAVHDAVSLAGRADLLVRMIRKWEELLQGGYDTFAECWGWGTPVHGWSSTPTRDLVSYILGITPGQPGFAEARIAPRLGGLTEVAGAVPTPQGLIEVRIANGTLYVDSPVPVCIVSEDGTEARYPAGIHQVIIS